MRKTTFIALLGITVAVIASVNPIRWSTTSINLGLVTKNEAQDLSFEFTNNSNESIRIIEAKGSCGCTNIDYPDQEILPGETASISAQFKSGKLGAFRKNIRIKTTESEEFTFLHFSGEVVE